MIFDACVIGGGAVGVAVARELSLRGKSVVLLEKNESCLSEASSGNTGLINLRSFSIRFKCII